MKSPLAIDRHEFHLSIHTAPNSIGGLTIAIFKESAEFDNIAAISNGDGLEWLLDRAGIGVAAVGSDINLGKDGRVKTRSLRSKVSIFFI